MNRDLEHAQRSALVWMPERGVGYFEVEGAQYDAAYFAQYERLGDTDMGAALNRHRVQLVKAWASREAQLLDVGVGSGTFLEHWNASPAEHLGGGFDVNPAAVAWLKERGWWWGDLYARPWDTLTFWDSLEHIREPSLALAQAATWAFVAVPIFTGPDHVLASRHYKPSEHYWYWTRRGFVRFAESCGFDVVDIRATETALGRDGIESFVLRRFRPAA